MNELNEFNEMLCERLGVGEGEDIGFAEWRRKREGQRKKVQEEKLSLQREVQSGLLWSALVTLWSAFVVCIGHAVVGPSASSVWLASTVAMNLVVVLWFMKCT